MSSESVSHTGLFSGEKTITTTGIMECALCHRRLGSGHEYANFAMLTVADCCFKRLEDELLKRMPHILEWYKKRVEQDQVSVNQRRAALEGLGVVLSQIS